MKIRTSEQNAARFLKVLGSLTRLRILKQLQTHGRLSVMDLAQKLGMEHSAVSHQLAQLRVNAIVNSIPEGRLAFYFISNSKEGSAVKAVLDLV